MLGIRVLHVCKYSALNPSMENKITGGRSNLKMENKNLDQYLDFFSKRLFSADSFQCMTKSTTIKKKTLFYTTYNFLNLRMLGKYSQK